MQWTGKSRTFKSHENGCCSNELVGLIRLWSKSVKIFMMPTKIFKFLIKIYERGDTMFRGDGDILLFTTDFDAFFLFLFWQKFTEITEIRRSD